MFGKSKESKRQPRTANDLAQYGIFEVPDSLDNLMEDNDEDLEAELANLMNDDGSAPKRNRKAKPVPDMNLDAIVSESMKDIDSGDEESSGEDDPELLNELSMITGEEAPALAQDSESPRDTQNSEIAEGVITLLNDRLELYKKAQSKAAAMNEMGKARRYGRGIKTLEELLNNAKGGKEINEADIPPVLPASATADKNEEPTETFVTPPENETVDNSQEIQPEKSVAENIDQESLNLLKQRQNEYKTVALAWKKAGNMEEALNHVKIAKQFDIVITAVSNGETIDLSDMPPAPVGPVPIASNPVDSIDKKDENKIQNDADADSSPPVEEQQPKSGVEDIGSALKERLEVYRRTKVTAETEGNASKARRYGRICKQFEDAIKLYSRGKSVPLDELPVPPGFPPLSVTQPSAIAPVPPKPKEPVDSATISSDKLPSERTERKAPTPPARGKKGKLPGTSRADKQMMLLQQRQHELKQAALNAKKDGDVELARDYLRQAKGIDPLIQASLAGLPVDMNSIPLSPTAKIELDSHGVKADDDFSLISSVECLDEAQGTDEQIYENLEKQLFKQIKWCLSTRDHSKALGDVPGYNRWERLALSYTRDLDMLRVRKRDSLPPPQHHYEMKTYAIVQSCTDLNDSDVEISIMRGVNYHREADTYVIYEFPYPGDNAPTDRTSTIRASKNPEYQAVFSLSDTIDRNSRQCQRAFKRHALKCQVWAKGCSLNPLLCCTHPRGFFRSDSLLGTVTIKLQPLETKCILHDTFPLMDGRKAVGGKLEIKIRLRNPILTKQIEQITDKWLSIDH